MANKKEISQYFKVMISSPEEAPNQVSVDYTKYIYDKVKVVDEDGLIKTCSFDLKEGFLLMDILSIGMRVSLVGGDLDNYENHFDGTIDNLTPNFEENGDVVLSVSCKSMEGKRLGKNIRDVVYPSKNNPFDWAKHELTYSDIIINLAKESKVRVDSENIGVIKKNITAGKLKGTVRQHNTSDWAFIQFLANKIGCTVWTTEKKGFSYLHIKDNTEVVSSLGDVSFFFLARTSGNNFVDIVPTDRMIQMVKCKVELDTKNSSSKFKQIQTKNKNGEPTTSLVTERTSKGENGEDIKERWVLDEEKVKRVAPEERMKMIELFMSGKVTWEGNGSGTLAAKNYFKQVVTQESSREGIGHDSVIEVSNSGDLSKSGVKTQNAVVENSGSSGTKLALKTESFKGMSAETRSSLLGRASRRELTDEDYKKYFDVVDTTPKSEKSDRDEAKKGQGQDTNSGVKKSKGFGSVSLDSNRDKRDSGFKITATIYNTEHRIEPRKSYILEGLGKYSCDYYLYRIERVWGDEGHTLDLTFTK